MKRIESYKQWVQVAEQQRPFLLFVKTNNCSVCDGLYPQVAELSTTYPLPFYVVNVVDVPELAGQLSLFSAPVVVLFNQGREYSRFARFVRMDDLKRRMKELLERGKAVD